MLKKNNKHKTPEQKVRNLLVKQNKNNNNKIEDIEELNALSTEIDKVYTQQFKQIGNLFEEILVQHVVTSELRDYYRNKIYSYI